MDIKEAKILIAEDDPETRNMLGRLIGFYCGNVVTAEDGAEALDMFCSDSPDIVITDIAMPRMTGLELIDSLRKEGYATDIVVITAYDGTEVDRGGIRLMNKPVQVKELVGELKSIAEGLSTRQ